MEEKSKRRRRVGLWICNALIVAILLVLLLLADHFREGPGDGPAMTIRVDHPGVMDGDAAMLIAFIERAVSRKHRNGIDVRFLGESTDLTVYFGGSRWQQAIKADMMLIEVGPTAYVERGEVIDKNELSSRLKRYSEAATMSGMQPLIALRVKKDVSLSRLLEFFELSVTFGRIHYEMESVTARVE